MALGRSVWESYREEAQADREFREGCLEDTVDLMLSGEPDVGLISLHHHIYATMGFEKMGALIGKSPDELEEMLLPPNGDPPASTLFKIIGLLLDDEGVDFNVSVVRRDATEARNDASGSIKRPGERTGERPADVGGKIDADTDSDEGREAERMAVSAGTE